MGEGKIIYNILDNHSSGPCACCGKNDFKQQLMNDHTHTAAPRADHYQIIRCRWSGYIILREKSFQLPTKHLAAANRFGD